MNDANWYSGKTFSTDWTTRHLIHWEDVLAPRRLQPLNVLEIGSWEGRSALFFLNYLPACRLTCIDTFAGSREHHQREKWSSQLAYIEARFDGNLAEFAARYEKIKQPSLQALAELVVAERRFDVVLIDGSHHSADVLSDAVLTWPLVTDGGIIIFDDYDWNQDIPEAEKPKPAVDAFLSMHSGEYVERHRDYQLIIEKHSV